MRRLTSIILVVFITLGQIIPHFVQPVLAQTIPSILQMPSSGAVLTTSPIAEHLLIKGLKVNLENPFQFDFIVDTGDSGLEGQALQFEAQKLMRYFLTALTVPEEDIWVNLSPVESDRIVPESLGQTRMGRDMLALDYLLKQMTASLMYPEGETGKDFWNDIHQKAQQVLGSTSIPVDTFHKVWIVPEKAVVYEEGSVGYIVETHLKVMLEEDYLALQTYQEGSSEQKNSVKDMGSQSLSDIVLPILEKEVNEGEHFAPLRQIYHALILSEWYKKKFQQSLLAQVYVDQSKIDGDKHGQQTVVKDIYEKYLDNMRQGSYDLIKEEINPATEEIQLRKYFSGGLVYQRGSSSITTDKGIFKKAIAKAKKLLLVSSLVVFTTLATVASVSAQTSPDVGIIAQAARQERVDALSREYGIPSNDELFSYVSKDFETNPQFFMSQFVNRDNVIAMFGYLLMVENQDLRNKFFDFLKKDPSLYNQIKPKVYRIPDNLFAIQIFEALDEEASDNELKDLAPKIIPNAKNVKIKNLTSAYRSNIDNELFQLWHGSSTNEQVQSRNTQQRLFLRIKHLKALKDLFGDDIVSKFLIPQEIDAEEFDSYLGNLSDVALPAFVRALQNIFSKEELQEYLENDNTFTLSNLPYQIPASDLLGNYNSLIKEYPVTMERSSVGRMFHWLKIGLEKTKRFIEFQSDIHGRQGMTQALNLISAIAKEEDFASFESYSYFKENILPDFDEQYQSDFYYFLSDSTVFETEYYNNLPWIQEANRHTPKEIQDALDAARNLFKGFDDAYNYKFLITEYILKYSVDDVTTIQTQMDQILGTEGTAIITNNVRRFLEVLGILSQTYEEHRKNTRGPVPDFLKSFGNFGQQVLQWADESTDNKLDEMYTLNQALKLSQNVMIGPRQMFLNLLERVATQGGSDMFVVLNKNHPYLLDYKRLGQDGAIEEIKKGIASLPHPRTFFDSSLGGDSQQKLQDFVAYSLHALAVVRILDPEVITSDYYQALSLKTMSEATIVYNGSESFNANTLLEFGSELLKKVDYSVLALMGVLMHEYGHHMMRSLLSDDSDSFWEGYNDRTFGEASADSVSARGLEILGYNKDGYKAYMNLMFALNNLNINNITDSKKHYHDRQRYQGRLVSKVFAEQGVGNDPAKFYEAHKIQTIAYTEETTREEYTFGLLSHYLGKTQVLFKRWLKRSKSYFKGIVPEDVIRRFIGYEGQDFLDYIVQSGDSLSLIAQEFNEQNGTNITAEDIAKYNNIKTPSLIKVGLKIKIPFSASSVVGVDLNSNNPDQSSTPVGGVDLSNKNWELIIQNVDGVSCQKDDQSGCMNIPFSPDQIKAMQANIPGLVPIIINIQPVSNLPLILGMDDRDLPTDPTVYASSQLLAAKY